MPVAALWYFLRAWVFRATDATRSCFFIPCTEPSASRLSWGQFLVAAGSCGLVAYHVYLVAKDWRGNERRHKPGNERGNERLGSVIPIRIWKRRGAVVSLD
jgi:hypothetical protein